MKNETLVVSMDPERLRALRFYGSQKGVDIGQELNTFANRLYEKYVPAATREYIEMLAADEDNAQKKRRDEEE